MILDEHYSVEHDGTQWVLSYERVTEKVNVKTGKNEISKKQFYHNTLNNSIKSYVDKKLAEGENVSDTIQILNGLLDKVKSLNLNELK